MSQLLERWSHGSLSHILKQHDLLSRLQSAYRSGHSTESATVLRVLSDILMAIDSGDVAVLAMLDLSAAFDTVYHQIVLERLRTSFGISDLALYMFQPYLKDRVHHTVQTAVGIPIGPFYRKYNCSPGPVRYPDGNLLRRRCCHARSFRCLPHTVCHQILFKEIWWHTRTRLLISFGISILALFSFQSYLKYHVQNMQLGTRRLASVGYLRNR